MVSLKSTSSRAPMQVLRCGAQRDLAGCASVRPTRLRTQFPGLLLFIQPHSLDALIGCFKFHLPFSVFTLVFLLGSRLLTISNWIPLGLRSPSTSNTDSRILSLLTPPYPVYQISIKDFTFHQVSQASTYSHLPLIFFSPTLHLTHQKKFFWFIIDLGSPSDFFVVVISDTVNTIISGQVFCICLLSSLPVSHLVLYNLQSALWPVSIVFFFFFFFPLQLFALI